MNPVFFPWLISVALVGGRDLVNAHRLPFPSRFLASFVAFGILGGLADTQARGPATMIAWGLDVAIFMTFAQTNVPVLTALGKLLGASGQPTPPAPPPPPSSSGSPAVAPASTSTLATLPGGQLV